MLRIEPQKLSGGSKEADSSGDLREMSRAQSPGREISGRGRGKLRWKQCRHKWLMTRSVRKRTGSQNEGLEAFFV